MNLSVLQDEVRDWSDRNFSKSRGLDAASWCMLGVSEEAGELAHSLLKLHQNIRMNEDHVANAKDAVGDLVIYLTDLCTKMNWSIDECVSLTWDGVKQRDWVKNPTNGQT